MPSTLLGPFCVFHHPSKKMYEAGRIISIVEMNNQVLEMLGSLSKSLG